MVDYICKPKYKPLCGDKIKPKETPDLTMAVSCLRIAVQVLRNLSDPGPLAGGKRAQL